MKKDAKTCLSYWFPIVEAAGLPVPETRIVRANCDLSPLLDGDTPEGFLDFLRQLREAARSIGGDRWFLRTGLTSGKHGWKDTCCVADLHRIGSNVAAIVEYSCLVDLMGLPFDVWAIREMLNTEPAFFAFQQMPITKEFRYFVRDGVIEHIQPYWDPVAFEHLEAVATYNGKPRAWLSGKISRLNTLSKLDSEILANFTLRASRAVPGYWSVDWLLTTDRGWVLIDMAEGANSDTWEPDKNAQTIC